MTETRSSVCPHDCPSTCALDVEVLDRSTIGTVRGADNPYTAGVVCNKVARYAERVHHPDRIVHRLELADATLRASGYPSAQELAARRWVDVQLPFERAHSLDGLGHPDKRFHFRADWRALGDTEGRLPPLPDWAPLTDQATEERPLRLVAAPARQFLNSSFTETPTARKREGRPQALICPEDGERFGIGDGALMRLGNSRGEVVLHARHVPGQTQGTVIVESIWPASAFGGLQHGINVLTSDEPALPAGGAVFHDTAVWMRPELAAAFALAAEQPARGATPF